MDQKTTRTLKHTPETEFVKIGSHKTPKMTLVTFEKNGHFGFYTCSLMHDLTDHSHFHTEGSQLVWKQPCQIVLPKPFLLKSYTISIRGGGVTFLLCLYTHSPIRTNSWGH